MTLTSVVVTDPSVTVTCPAAAATLDPGETATCTASHALTQADIDAGQVDNTADVDSTAPQGQTVSDTDSATVFVPQIRTISIDKSGSLDITSSAPTTRANPGDTISYSFALENTGNVTLTGVIVSDPLGHRHLPGRVGHPRSGGDPDLHRRPTSSARPTSMPARSTTRRRSSSTAPQGQTVADSDDETVLVPQIVTLDLSKSGSLDVGLDGRAGPGDMITLHLRRRATPATSP